MAVDLPPMSAMVYRCSARFPEEAPEEAPEERNGPACQGGKDQKNGKEDSEIRKACEKEQNQKTVEVN